MAGQEEDNRRGHRERLRKRLQESGIQSFRDYEVIELALTFANRRGDTKSQAKSLIKEFGSVAEILEAEPARLMKVAGVGKAAAEAFAMIRGIAEYYRKDKAKGSDFFSGPSEVIRYVQQKLRGLGEEQFFALYLDARNRFIDDETISKGTTVRTTVYPANIFESAFKHNAAAVVLAHNHPGGKSTPSEQDFMLTMKLMLVGDYLDKPVVDHVIVAGAEYYSMAERGDIARLKNRLREKHV
jgi:DNA repair protein RadC